MSWNFRSKLKFSQCFKKIHTHTHTHTHKIRVHTQKKKKNFLVIRRGLSSRMVDDASILLWVSLFGIEFFVTHPLTSVVAISQEKLNPPPILRGVLHTFALLP
jgi:hypothetical protein